MLFKLIICLNLILGKKHQMIRELMIYQDNKRYNLLLALHKLQVAETLTNKVEPIYIVDI